MNNYSIKNTFRKKSAGVYKCICKDKTVMYSLLTGQTKRKMCYVVEKNLAHYKIINRLEKSTLADNYFLSIPVILIY